MKRDHIRRVITDRYETVFPTHYGLAIPTGFENHAFTPPPGTPHARMYIYETAKGRASIGTSRIFEASSGFAFFEVYVPKDEGTKTMNDIIDALSATFDNSVLVTPFGCNVMLGMGKVTASGTSQQDGFYWKTWMVRYRAR